MSMETMSTNWKTKVLAAKSEGKWRNNTSAAAAKYLKKTASRFGVSVEALAKSKMGYNYLSWVTSDTAMAASEEKWNNSIDAAVKDNLYLSGIQNAVKPVSGASVAQFNGIINEAK